MSRVALEAGAAAAGIPAEFLDLAIQELKAEREREAAQRAARRRVLKTAGIAVAALLAISALLSHRALNGRLAEVEMRRTQLENVLQRRHDLIPNLLAIAKVSAAHEKELIASLNDVYRRLGTAQEFERREALEQELGEGVRRVLTIIQGDPKSSSMALFIGLSDELAGAENRISVERKRYNEAVVAYNRTARGFPVFLVRPFLGFPKSMPPFRASEEATRPPSL